MSDYYDKQGKPIDDALKWGRMFEDIDYQIIKQETVPSGKYWVSTVWLGLDHGFGSGPPLIFETMVFPKEDGETSYGEEDVNRYSTEAQALAGHRKMVKKWSKK